MQHRQPRLGDILDDYCPRERRLTNHVVVAMVDADVKQTRCTTCEAEHEYKHAKVPSVRKKKDAPAALYKQVLADAQPESVKAAESAAPAPPAGQPAPAQAEPQRDTTVQAAPEPQPAEAAPAEESEEGTKDEGPVHRRLIRATLPRPEGPVQRPLPQFTVRQPGKFGGNARGGGRPQGGGMGSMTRPRTSPSRGSFGRNGSRETFTTRPSGGGAHHGHQRSRPAHGPAGRPMRHGKKSPK